MSLTEKEQENSRNFWKYIWVNKQQAYCATFFPCVHCDDSKGFSFYYVYSVHSKRGFFETVLCKDCWLLLMAQKKEMILKFADLLVLNEGMSSPNFLKVDVVSRIPLGCWMFDAFSNILGDNGKNDTVFSAAVLESDYTVDNTVLAGRESWEGGQIGLQPDSDGLIASDRDEDGFIYLNNVSKSVPLLKSGLDEERLLLQKRKFFPWKLTEEEKVKLGLIEKKLLR